MVHTAWVWILGPLFTSCVTLDKLCFICPASPPIKWRKGKNEMRQYLWKVPRTVTGIYKYSVSVYSCLSLILQMSPFSLKNIRLAGNIYIPSVLSFYFLLVYPLSWFPLFIVIYHICVFLNFFFFLIWTIFKSLLNLLQYYLCFGFLAMRHVGS